MCSFFRYPLPCLRHVQGLEAELKQERQHVHSLAQTIQQANTDHLLAAASINQAEGRIAAFLHRYHHLSFDLVGVLSMSCNTATSQHAREGHQQPVIHRIALPRLVVEMSGQLVACA